MLICVAFGKIQCEGSGGSGCYCTKCVIEFNDQGHLGAKVWTDGEPGRSGPGQLELGTVLVHPDIGISLSLTT